MEVSLDLTKQTARRSFLMMLKPTSSLRSGLDHEWVESSRVGHIFPGLRDSGAPAVFQPDAGTVLAEVALGAQLRSFRESGGELLKAGVDGVDPAAGGLRLRLSGRSRKFVDGGW